MTDIAQEYFREISKDTKKVQILIDHILEMDDEGVNEKLSELLTLIFLVSGKELSEKLKKSDEVIDTMRELWDHYQAPLKKSSKDPVWISDSTGDPKWKLDTTGRPIWTWPNVSSTTGTVSVKTSNRTTINTDETS